MELHLAILKTFESTVAKLLVSTEPVSTEPGSTEPGSTEPMSTEPVVQVTKLVESQPNVKIDSLLEQINNSITRLEARISLLEREKKQVWNNDIVELNFDKYTMPLVIDDRETVVDLNIVEKVCDTTPQVRHIDEDEPDIEDNTDEPDTVVEKGIEHGEQAEEEAEEAEEEAEEAEEEAEEAEEEAEEAELEEIKYNNSTYYRDADGFCYTMNSDGELDEEPVGVWSTKKSLVQFYKRT